MDDEELVGSYFMGAYDERGRGCHPNSVLEGAPRGDQSPKRKDGCGVVGSFGSRLLQLGEWLVHRQLHTMISCIIWRVTVASEVGSMFSVASQLEVLLDNLYDSRSFSFFVSVMWEVGLWGVCIMWVNGFYIPVYVL